jgi:pilus assembly protein TadC
VAEPGRDPSAGGEKSLKNIPTLSKPVLFIPFVLFLLFCLPVLSFLLLESIEYGIPFLYITWLCFTAQLSSTKARQMIAAYPSSSRTSAES